MSSNIKGKDIVDNHPGPGPSKGDRTQISSGNHHNHHQNRQPGTQLSRYESQKRRDWNTFTQYINNQLRPAVGVMSEYSPSHVLDFLRYLDQFGKTKVHLHGCMFFGQPNPPGPCTCPLRQAWGSLDALIGRLRAAYEENGGPPETNPFASGSIRMYLREVRDSQGKARGVPYKKKKKKRINQMKPTTITNTTAISDGSSRYNPIHRSATS